MPNITDKMRKFQNKCPMGYTVAAGQNIDMLGKSEYWRIFENHPEPYMVRIPEDFIDTPFGPAAKRIPEEWGKCLYYKVV